MTEDVLERFLFLEDDLANLRLTVHQDHEYRIAALEKESAMLRYVLNGALQLLGDAGLLEQMQRFGLDVQIKEPV